MSCGLSSVKGGRWGIIQGSIVGGTKGDTDYSSFCGPGIRDFPKIRGFFFEEALKQGLVFGGTSRTPQVRNSQIFPQT